MRERVFVMAELSSVCVSHVGSLGPHGGLARL